MLTTFNGVRAALAGSGLPKWLWGEALAYVVHVYNRTARHALQGRSPFEVRYGHAPDVSNLREWGCHVVVSVPTDSKLDARGREACWLGLDRTSNGHRIYWPKERKISHMFPTLLHLLSSVCAMFLNLRARHHLSLARSVN